MIATGQQYSVREFVQRCAKLLELELTWQGSGVDEKAVDAKGNVHRRRRSALLPPHRGGDAAGRSGQGAARAGLDAAHHLRRAGRRDGGGRPEGRPARCAGASAWLRCLQRSRDLGWQEGPHCSRLLFAVTRVS